MGSWVDLEDIEYKDIEFLTFYTTKTHELARLLVIPSFLVVLTEDQKSIVKVHSEEEIRR